jgi:hypothetical protein
VLDPGLTMQTPTAAQLRTAIDVLKMLGERINNNAANAVMDLPEAQCYDRHAASIESRTIEQIGRIEIVNGQLEECHVQLQQQRKQGVSHHI